MSSIPSHDMYHEGYTTPTHDMCEHANHEESKSFGQRANLAHCLLSYEDRTSRACVRASHCKAVTLLSPTTEQRTSRGCWVKPLLHLYPRYLAGRYRAYSKLAVENTAVEEIAAVLFVACSNSTRIAHMILETTAALPEINMNPDHDMAVVAPSSAVVAALVDFDSPHLQPK